MTDTTHLYLIKFALAAIMLACAWVSIRYWPETEHSVPDVRNLHIMQIVPVITFFIAFGMASVLAITMVSH